MPETRVCSLWEEIDGERIEIPGSTLSLKDIDYKKPFFKFEAKLPIDLIKLCGSQGILFKLTNISKEKPPEYTLFQLGKQIKGTLITPS